MSLALCTVWLLAVALIVLWPTPVDRAGGSILRGGLDYLYTHGLPTFITHSLVEFTANVLMFVPLGLFWFLLTPRRWRRWAPIVGLALSAVIEATQHILLPQRFATPYDVLANTLGATLGALIAAAFQLSSASPRQER
ncbi:VanZ family protein [Arthrobacter sp. MDT1-65]